MPTRFRAALVAATLLTPAAALAQTNPADRDEPAPRPDAAVANPVASGISEIVVTARKVEESINDAPVAVTAFTEEQLEDREIRDIADLSQFTPGLSFSQAFGRSGDRPVIRGLSNVLAGVQFGVESGTSIFLDGALFRGDVQTLNFDSIERVEIVKGPQSALYGRNTYAGAINFITKTPGPDFSGFAKGRVAEDDEYELTAGVDLPLVADLIAVRLDGRYFEYGGQYRNTLTGRKVGQQQSYGGSVTAFLTPTPDIDLRVRAQYSEDDDGPTAFFLQPASANNCRPGFRSTRFRAGGRLRSDNPNQYFCGTIRPRPDLIALNTDRLADGTPDGTGFDGTEVDRFFTTANVDWNLGGSGFTVTGIAAYRDETQRFGSDSDFSDANIFFGSPAVVEPLFANTTRSDFTDYSFELRLATPQDRPIRGLIGGFYYNFEDEGRDITFASGGDGVPFGTPGPGNDRSTIVNKSLFGRVEAEFGTVTVAAEGRYFDERKTLTEFFAAGPTTYPEFQTDGFTPRFTVDWQPTRDTLLYAIYAEGDKPGGINGAAGATINRFTYRDESLRGGEVGIKQSLLDRRLQVNVSAYYNDVSDVQLTTSIPNATGTSAVTSIATNQGNAEVKGLEVEIQAAPSDHLRVGFTYAYVDSRFTSGCDDFEYTLNTGGLRPTFDTENPPASELPFCTIAGNRLPLGSPHQFSATIDGDYPLSATLDLVGNVNFSFEDSKFVQVHNLAKTGTTELLNARIGVASENFQVSVFGRNLLDEDSVPLATRWFDLRYGFAPRDIPFGALARAGQVADTGLPRAFFAPLRRGRQFGLEVKVGF